MTPPAADVTEVPEAYDHDRYQRWLESEAFGRQEARRRRLKTKLDCGHWIDGGEPYRYQVWRTNGDPRGMISQRTDCEFCARADLRF